MILSHVSTHGYPPSVREIGQAVGLHSSSSVAHQLQVLQARGYLTRTPGVNRGLTVVGYTGPSQDAVSELRVAALRHAIECYAGPADDTVPVLQFWLEELLGEHDGDQG